MDLKVRMTLSWISFEWKMWPSPLRLLLSPPIINVPSLIYCISLIHSKYLQPCCFANEFSYIPIQVPIVIFSYKQATNGSSHFSKRTPSFSFIFLQLLMSAPLINFLHAKMASVSLTDAWPNASNISTQHLATLLSKTCCIRLNTLLRYVAKCWMI